MRMHDKSLTYFRYWTYACIAFITPSQYDLQLTSSRELSSFNSMHTDSE
jgi:hypothetical protein